MGRRCTIIIICVLLAALSGCAGGQAREIAQLQIIQTIGFDGDARERTVSVSTGASDSGESPVRLWAAGPSLHEAMERIQDFSVKEEIFYANAAYILLGEGAAADALPFLDFAGRSAQIRLATPLFIVRGDEARRLVMEAGGEDSDISQIMDSLARDLRQRETAQLFTCGEVAQRLLRDGAALVNAVRPVRDEASGEETLTALHEGYAILRGGALCGYLTGETALGAALLLGGAGRAQLELSGGVTVALSGGAAEVSPVWGADGALTGLEAEVSVSAVLVEDGGGARLSDEETRRALEAELARRAAGWVETVLATSRRLEADFLGLGRRLELGSPRRWRAMPVAWAEALPALTLSVTGRARLTHTYNLEDPLRAEGGASHG